MLEGIGPILQFFIVLFLRLTSLVKGVAKIVMTLALQAGIL